MADLRAAAALADDSRFREAVVDGLTELMKATAHLREQNAAFLAHHEELARRVGELERRDEQQTEKAQARQINILQRQIDLDWKMIGLMVMAAGYALQAFGGFHLAVVR